MHDWEKFLIYSLFCEYADQKEEAKDAKGAKVKKLVEITRDDVKKVVARLCKDECYIGKIPNVSAEDVRN